MQRTVASFALATLSLLASYVIVASWPSVVPKPDPMVASVPAVHAQSQVATTAMVDLAE